MINETIRKRVSGTATLRVPVLVTVLAGALAAALVASAAIIADRAVLANCAATEVSQTTSPAGLNAHSNRPTGRFLKQPLRMAVK